LTITGTATGLSNQTATLEVTVTAAPAGSYTLATNPATLSIQQGANGNSTVTLTRSGGFTGEVALAVTGMPAGMTAVPVPAATTGTSSVVTVTVGAGVAVGTYPLTITGTATGLSNQTATLEVTVTAGGGAGVSFTFCDDTGIPLWVAYQDGNGSWAQASGAGNVYSFNLSSAKGAVAFVTDEGLGQTATLVYFGTAAELTSIGASQCETPAGTSKSLNGSVAGLGLTDQSTISMGGGFASVSGAGPNTFVLQGVADGPEDLLAVRTPFSFGGGGFTSRVDKMIIRRDLNPSGGSTLPVLDFGSGEAFDPESRNLTINNLGSDLPLVSLTYITANGSTASLFTELDASTTIPAVPAGMQAGGDLHFLNVIASPDVTDPDNQRGIGTMFKSPADKTVNLGPTMGPVAVTVASAAPYARLRGQYTVQSEYNSVWVMTFAQSGGVSSVSLIVTPGHQGGGTTFDYTIPNFSTAAGWNDAWGMVSGLDTSWTLSATGWSAAGGIIGSPYVDGTVVKNASRSGQIIP
jgi:hypothetical protein